MPVRAGRTISIADADVAVILPEDIVPVGGAVHPPGHGSLGGAVGIPDPDVFTPPAANVPSLLHPLPGSGSIRTGVRHVIVQRHVDAVAARRSHQGIVHGECRQTGAGALIVDQGDNLGFISAVVNNITSRRRGRGPGGESDRRRKRWGESKRGR